MAESEATSPDAKLDFDDDTLKGKYIDVTH